MGSRARSRSAPPGLTTLELLLVVGVLTILGAIVFGVVALTRARARNVGCVMARRQIVVAGLQYAADHKMTDQASLYLPALASQHYLIRMPSCPCQGWLSVGKPGAPSYCTVHDPVQP